MAKGLCFLCDQPDERGHKCANKGKQLFLIEVLDDKEEKEGQEVFDGTMEFDHEEATPQISINAFLAILVSMP